MTIHYDLTRESWVPVVMKDGSFRELGLRDLFAQAHDIRDIVASNRVERLALMHVLTAITMRAYPDWDETWNRGSFEESAINAYLDTYEHKFDLFGDTPFYQVRNLDEAVGNERAVNPISAMFLTKHVTTQSLGESETLTLKEVVPVLITQATYAQPGAIMSTSLSGKNSFSWTSTGFLAMGDSLFSTIMLNTVECTVEGYDWEKDRPWWERDEGPRFGETRVPEGTADYLTYQHRGLELVLNEENRVEGFKIWQGEIWKPDNVGEMMFFDPFSIYTPKKQKDENSPIEWKRERFQSRGVRKNAEKKRSAYVTAGIIGGLFILYSPQDGARSLVHDRVKHISSNYDRFVGYEVARLIVDASMGTLVESLVEEGLKVPYKLEADPEAVAKVSMTIEQIYGLHFAFEQGLKRLLPNGLLEEANAELSHFIDARVRKYLTSGGEDTEVLLHEVASKMVTEFDRWCERVPVKSWEENYKATWGFTKQANEILKPKENDA